MDMTPFGTGSADDAVIAEWRSIIVPAGDTLGRLAGTTEDEFLQIGSQMQDFYQRSSEIAAMANRLVESVSGDRVHALIDHLRQMMGDMEAYLTSARSQSRDSCGTLERILELLGQVSEPLEGFQKMTKALRMLGISTKIESSRLGEMGAGFQTLALDVEKLSQLVSEKSSSILGHRQLLAGMITDNLRIVRTSEAAQDREVGGVLASSSRSLEELVSVNGRCGSFGSLVSAISAEVSANISEVVASMQMHDMTRQQVEHIVEALERLSVKLRTAEGAGLAPEDRRRLVVEAGDVCELQSAQLRHAASELCEAVRSIAANLRDVAGRLVRMTSETCSITGVADSSGGSFMDAISRGMGTVTSVLATCAQSDRDMASTLARVAATMQEVTGFVTDIEDIGSEIDLIALNSQIKAAHTGREGAALGVLAEAIKRLSVDAITQTDAVSRTLLQINQSTAHLFQGATEETEQLGARIAVMEEELSGILAELGSMNADLMHLLSGLSSRVALLSEDIERATSGMDVHERVATMADDVVGGLDRIVARARDLEPASTEFKENLRHMEERYTMQSERRIHEHIARSRGVSGGSPAAQQILLAPEAKGAEESEFGDNVDLF
ncbi:MAG TPA: methyl-accepting chemotaxis protein [Desulfuromonadaceae bacterium]